MDNNQSINRTLADRVSPDIQRQYAFYVERVRVLNEEFRRLKTEGDIVGILLERMKNQNLIDNHISSIMNLIQNDDSNQPTFFNDETKNNLDKIQKYFYDVEQACSQGLKTIFDIRQFLTGQKFIIYLEENGKIFEFSLENIEQHIGSIIPIYTNSLEKMIHNMTLNSRVLAPELRNLGFSLKKIDTDNEIKNINNYQKYVKEYAAEKNIEISKNRQLEMAIYLYSRRPDVDFSNPSDKKSLSQLFYNYSNKGGLSDNITMYKLGDAIQQVEDTFTNIEVKMHNGTISLVMIANGIGKLYQIFSKNSLDGQKSALINFFTVNSGRLSSVIEKNAQKNIIKKINEIFTELK